MSNTLSENSHIIKLAHTDLFKTNLPFPREKKPETVSMGFSEASLASAASKLLPQGPIITAHHSAVCRASTSCGRSLSLQGSGQVLHPPIIQGALLPRALASPSPAQAVRGLHGRDPPAATQAKGYRLVKTKRPPLAPDKTPPAGVSDQASCHQTEGIKVYVYVSRS